MKNTVTLAVLALVAVTCDAQSAEPVDPAAEGLTTISSMTEARAAHTATLLMDGQVLIAGGLGSGETASLELFDPVSREFRTAGKMAVARASHTATRLASGKVLIAGGFNGDYLDSVELFDPVTGQSTVVGRMTQPRSGHTAVVLEDGKILLAGGVSTGWTFLSTAELYDPETNSFTPVGSMSVARESHTASRLQDGSVLIIGGHRGRRESIVIFSSAERYDPVARSFSPAGDLSIPRHKHDALMLRDGRVLVTGGSDARDDRGMFRSTEFYLPAQRRFDAGPQLRLARFKHAGNSILLGDGRALIAGGAPRGELFDPAAKQFTIVDGDARMPGSFSASTALADGSVLITGGYGNGATATRGAWLYR
jgi:hypothetical protein